MQQNCPLGAGSGPESAADRPTLMIPIWSSFKDQIRLDGSTGTAIGRQEQIYKSPSDVSMNAWEEQK